MKLHNQFYIFIEKAEKENGNFTLRIFYENPCHAALSFFQSSGRLTAIMCNKPEIVHSKLIVSLYFFDT